MTRKSKNNQHFSNQIISKTWKTLAFNEKIHDKFIKKWLQNQYDLPLISRSHRNGIKMQKNYQKFAKTQIIEAIKINSNYLNFVLQLQLLFIKIQLKSYQKIKFTRATFENHWDLITRLC